MTGISKEEKAALVRFDITRIIQIRLVKLKVYTYSKKGTKPHKCHLCKYSSRFKPQVRRHLQCHTGEKPFACNLCNYKSTRRDGLNKHIITHTGEKHYSCVFCAKLFGQSSSKNLHENLCKQNPRQNDPSWVEMQSRFKCQLCPYSTAVRYSLKPHMMTHTEEKQFQCNLCSQKFSCRINLQNHISIHTREKPYNCQFCMTGFSQVATHKRHEKICKLNPTQGDAQWVEEQKKFKCHLCTYRTTAKYDLKRHLRSHTGEKPYKCRHCLYKSSISSNLRRHLRLMHADDITFKRPTC